MACESWKTKIESYVDDELPPDQTQAFATHVRTCAACAADALARAQTKRSIQVAGRRFTASPEFRKQIQERISKPQPTLGFPLWVIASAVLASLLVGSVGVSYLGRRREQRRELYSELVDQHVSTMASSSPVDVVSSDRHTVKPWFQGKIPFAFDLPEVQNSDFSLIGGRVTYLDQIPGAQLIYAVRKHRISVFIFPENALPVRLERNRGARKQASFSTETWSQGGLRYFAVGDASTADIDALAHLFKSPNS